MSIMPGTDMTGEKMGATTRGGPASPYQTFGPSSAAGAGGTVGGVVGGALGGPIGGAVGSAGGAAVGRTVGSMFGGTTVPWGPNAAAGSTAGGAAGLEGGSRKLNIPRLEGETAEAYAARIGAMDPEELMRLSGSGGVSQMAMPQGSYTKTSDTTNPNMNSTWANFIAPTFNQISRAGDQEMEQIRRQVPRGGVQDRAMGNAIRGRYAAKQNAWQSLVPGAISGLSQIGKEMYFQQPQAGDALGTMAGLASANQQYNLGLQQLKSQENQNAANNKAGLLGTAGSVLGTLGAAYLSGKK